MWCHKRNINFISFKFCYWFAADSFYIRSLQNFQYSSKTKSMYTHAHCTLAICTSGSVYYIYSSCNHTSLLTYGLRTFNLSCRGCGLRTKCSACSENHSTRGSVVMSVSRTDSASVQKLMDSLTFAPIMHTRCYEYY